MAVMGHLPPLYRTDLGARSRAAAIGLMGLTLYVSVARFDGLPRTYFALQDGYVVAVFIAVLMVLPSWQRAAAAHGSRLPAGSAPLALLGLMGALVLWAGTYGVMYHYPLTRDEHMAVFDMGILRSGRLIQPLAPAWRDFAHALVPAFLLDISGRAGLVSDYMPGNAMMRSMFASIADPALMNPILAVAGWLALHRAARRLFPNDRATQAVVLLLYATSAQVIVTAMTAYAMTAHLALNMMWLALFLRNERWSHAAALAAGFVATGLHQVIFHPLFVLPFLPYLVRQGEWRTALFYALGYGAIGLFWISYPHLAVSLSGLSTAGDGPAGFLQTRVLPLLSARDPAGLVLMSFNLLRFAAWQNLALIPLTLLALPLARRGEGVAKPLYYGILLTLFAMFVLLPYQGHGWGYRYLHGLIGSFALLAGYGWTQLADERAQAASFLRMSTLATVAVIIPFLLWTSHNFVRPYARVNAALDHIGADMLIIDTEPVPFAIDEVRNPADLTGRPIRLSSKDLDARQLSVLCKRGTIAFVPRNAMQALGLGTSHPSIAPRFTQLRASAPATCAIRPLTLR